MNDEMTWAEKIKYIFDKKKELPGGDKMSDKMDKCIKFVSADNEKKEYEVEVKIEKWMENPRNELHGGVCCTLFDTTMGHAAAAAVTSRKMATVDLYTNFIARMPGTETLVIKTRIIKAGRTFIRVSAEAYSKESGKLIASSASNFTVLNG